MLLLLAVLAFARTYLRLGLEGLLALDGTLGGHVVLARVQVGVLEHANGIS